jgi:transposase
MFRTLYDCPDSDKGMHYETRCSDRVKLLAWDGSGMMLVTKWLHQGSFTWPPIRDGVVHLSASQLTAAGHLELGPVRDDR